MSRITRCSAVALIAVVALLALAAGAGADDAPRLDGAKLMPTSGNTNTLWTFLVTYHGTATPSARLLYLDSKSYPLTSCGVGPTGGVMYRYQTKLTAGTHKYRFRFVVGTQTVLAPGPAETNWYTAISVKQGETATISGLVRCNGVGLAGVTLRLTQTGSLPVTVKTGSDGRYTAKSLATGAWRVTPSLSGYTFSPGYANVTVPPNTTTCNFAATRQERTGRTG